MVLQKTVYTLSQHPMYGKISPIARIHGSWNQGLEKGIFLLTITPSDPLGGKMLSVPATLSSLFPEGEISCQGLQQKFL